MRAVKNLWVHLDPSRDNARLLKLVAELQQRTRASVRLFSVLPPRPAELPSAMPTGIADPYALVEAAVRSGLEQAVQALEGYSVPASIALLVGELAAALIGEVEDNASTLVVKAAEPDQDDGAGHIRRYRATDNRLLRHCPCPVWLFRDLDRPCRRVVAAIDVGHTDAATVQLNLEILETAAFVSEIERAELHVLHAWTAFGEDLVASHTPTGHREYITSCQESARQRLDAIVATSRVELAPARVHLVKGDAERILPHFAGQQRADLLVMGTMGRTGIRGLLVGNRSEVILNQLECSLLTVRASAMPEAP